MFKNPFTYEGRIRRTEYGLSLIFSAIGYCIAIFLTTLSVNLIETDATGMSLLFWVFLLPVFYFNVAQNTKRCHDLGHTGWYQLIPFYGFWLLFAEGQEGVNEYGHNPKEIHRYEALSEIRSAS